MDDGYSGTNFDRPAFIEMMELVQQGRVKTILVKDLSRLGRNYLEVGRYADITELDEELVHTLIEKIVIHEKEILDGHPVMRIEIYYRFIGKVQDQLSAGKTAKNKTEPAAPADSIA